VTEATPAAPPAAAEALAWRGFELDDRAGTTVGRIEGVYVDAEGGAPAWLAVVLSSRRRLFRRGSSKAVAVPLRECAAMPGRAWTAQGAEAVRGAPAIDPARPLLREHETAICAHYGIGPSIGRHAEVAPRPEGAVTATPA